MENRFLKEDYKVSDTMKVAKDEKYIQSTDQKLSDEFISFLSSSKKYTIGNISAKKQVIDFNLDFGTINKSNNFTSNAYDYCQTGVKFLITKNEEKAYMVALFVKNTPAMKSVGLYYLPDGNFDNICLVKRYCYHNKGNVHKNKLNDISIPLKTFHLHEMNEEYYNYCKEHFSGIDLIEKLQSPDAKIIDNVDIKNNIWILVNYAKQELNVSSEYVNIDINDESEIAIKFVEAIEEMEGNR